MYARKKTSVSVRPYKFYYFKRVRKILNSRLLTRRSRNLRTLFNNAKRKYHIEHVLARSKTKLIRKRKVLLKLQKNSNVIKPRLIIDGSGKVNFLSCLR